MKRLFTFLIVFAMVAGVAAGWGVHEYLPDGKTPHPWWVMDKDQALVWLGLATTIFLTLIKMIISPLVFTTLVAGIAHMEGAAAVGRVGAKTIFWFILASITSLTIGLLMVHWLQPGAGLHLVPANGAAATVDASKLNAVDFIKHMIPTSIFDAMAKNEILQIVIFSIFVGTAIASMEDKAPQVLATVEQGARIMLKVTGYIMALAPIAIFAALASTVAKLGIEVLYTYLKFVLGFYASLGVLWVVLFLAAFLFLGARAFNLFASIRAPILLAFSTASSEAAYPRTLEQLQKFGVSPKIASFVLPLGYSFNLDGSMMYCTFAVLFIAQVYGIQMSVAQQVTMLLLLMVTSKGMAGVPRASLVVIMATLAYFNMPVEGIALVLGVDQLLDMGRSGTNVVGNSVAAAVVARWEGQLSKPEPAAAGA